MEKDALLSPRIPVSTYRVQFNYKFRFSDAKNIIPYLNELGITDIYSSPYFKAKKESLHGYDIVDHNVLNPEIGTEEEYNEFINEIHKYGMRQILDIVPNHMCITGKENIWWMDVLENGPSSSYANFFDIDWKPAKKELENKVLLPILGDQYGDILERGELKLIFEEGAFFIYYYEHKFPIRPQTYIFILEHNLDKLKDFLTSEDPYFIELLSIMTAIKHLPQYTEVGHEKNIERQREKEVIKKRLWNLYNESTEIKTFIDENVVTFNGVKGKSKSFNLLDDIISNQVYRLSHWRVAAEEINYRRFFDINELASIRVEDPVVFDETHKLIFKLIKDGKVSGLRVDHPDGLYDPSDYFKRLQKNCFIGMRLGYYEKLREDNPAAVPVEEDIELKILKQYEEIISSDTQYKPFYIVGEKILTKGERMPEEWPIFSTTGYVFLNSLNGIFIEVKNAKAFDKIYTRFTRSKANFQNIVYEKKKLVMQVAMASEINILGNYLNKISEKNRHTRDFTLNSLIQAIIEVIAFFPVYRTYTNSWSITNDKDHQYIEYAISKATRKNPAINKSIFDFLKNILLFKFPEDFSDEDKKEWFGFVMRFQQITGPVMAKGLEDTTFYVYNRFVSMNEVGGMPERFGTPLETFHGQNIERKKFWPHALIATSTHDTKRSEDVRARINVLSEIPEEWKKRLELWSHLNKKKKISVDGQIVPGKNEEYLLYQTLIGVWPIGFQKNEEYRIFKNRIKDYLLKALREAKVDTSWINPNSTYEEAVMFFVDNIMSNGTENQFLNNFISFNKIISYYGMYNSLSQTLLKITSPGVPDFYQGTEIWNFCLVDPDNRKTVDYGRKIKMLNKMKKRELQIGLSELAKELTVNKEDGRIKLYLIYKALNYRKMNRTLFDEGEYIPVETIGERAENICAFVRKTESLTAIVVTPRFFTKLILQPESSLAGKKIWGDSFLAVPFIETGKRYRNVFTGAVETVKKYKDANAILLSELFTDFPVALMEELID